MKFPAPHLPKTRGFTLIEIMVATVVVVIMLGIVFQLTAATADVWRSTTGKIGAFQGARAGFDALARGLEQATLNTYLDYVDNQSIPQPRSAGNTNFIPISYARASELHFLSGPSFDPGSPTRSLIPGANADNVQGHAVFFQASLGITQNASQYVGLNRLLNAVGFYVEYTDDKPTWPSFIQNIMGTTPRFRFRLMQWIQPSEAFSVYQATIPVGSSANYSRAWFMNFIPAPGATSVSPSQTRPRMIAENIIAIFFRPRLSTADEDLLDGGAVGSATGGRLAPTYRYDSRMWTPNYIDPAFRSSATFAGSSPTKRLVDLTRNQLPPLMDVVMIAIDPKDAERLCRQATIPDPLKLPPNTFHLRGQPNAADFLFNPDASGKSDLQKFEDQLAAANINFRVFQSTITLKGAKWSAD